MTRLAGLALFEQGEDACNEKILNFSLVLGPTQASAMIRRQTSDPAHATWGFGPYTLDTEGNLRIGPTAIHLPPLQRRMLLALVRHKGRVLSRDVLLQEVWRHNQVSEVSISRTVHGLRSTFADGPLGPTVIRTIYGGGYRLDVPVRMMEEAPSSGTEPSGAAGFPPAHTLSAFVEGLVWVRRRDPRQLARAEKHLRQCLSGAPNFTPALVQLVATRLAQYHWGLVQAEELESEVEGLLQRAEETCNDRAAEVLALQVEVLSLLHWQPKLAEGRFAPWLPGQLPKGPPLHSWVRHLLATGRAAEALSLLEPHLSADNPDGWMLAAVACWFLGKPGTAITHLREQLSIDASLVGPRLILAHVLADSERPAEALRELEASTNLLDPSSGLQGFTALILALCGQTAEATWHVRRALGDGQQAGIMTSLWGLTALALGDEARAANLLEQAVRNRCGLAPFVRHLPGLQRRHAGSPALEHFQAAMTNRFRCTI